MSPQALQQKGLNEISLNVDGHIKNIDQILFAIYYLGIETVNLFSKSELTKEVKSRIRKTLTHMSGTEISYEDKQKITIKVLLDKTKVDITQVLYRITLILDLSIAGLLGHLDLGEIQSNESEIDRLYHLMAKIVSLSLIDSNILGSSHIRNVSLIPSYFLIGKKLENIGDNISSLAVYLSKNNVSFEHKKEILDFIKNEINRSAKHILQDFPKDFEKADNTKLKALRDHILQIKEGTILDYLRDTLRYTVDIEEEIVNMSFYTTLIKQNVL